MHMSWTSNLAGRLKNKHFRHEFVDRRKIAINLTQRVRIKFPHKRLSYWYDEISQGSIRTRKWIWQICCCSEKMRCCGWTFIKRKNWSIRKNYFIFSSLKQKTFLQSWSYWKKRNFGSGYKDSIYLVNSIFTGDAKFTDKLKDIIPTLL